ncbi:hypothetical protein CRE_08592 [Caenorhabditis remanei]|uniref:Uncharacterized protein n=1 Tax=Caenorhabditis remanei TaxID=31234 RepID=E3NIJ2_CAERE|nr:hypothetical protein CRE_08592 [Caenorhabditis remanei]
MTFDGVVVITEGMNRWSSGIFYTALSRARSLGTSRIVDVGTVQWSACRLALAELERMQRRPLIPGMTFHQHRMTFHQHQYDVGYLQKVWKSLRKEKNPADQQQATLVGLEE